MSQLTSPDDDDDVRCEVDSQDYFLCGADESVAKSNFTPFAGL